MWASMWMQQCVLHFLHPHFIFCSTTFSLPSYQMLVRRQGRDRGSWLPEINNSISGKRKERETAFNEIETGWGVGVEHRIAAGQLISDCGTEMVEIGVFVRPNHLPLFILGGPSLLSYRLGRSTAVLSVCVNALYQSLASVSTHKQH